jgi:hypothetical protein
MFKYRFLLAAMVLLAVLNLGQAQEAGEMPAELEISLDRAAKQGLGYHISGTIPLHLPEADDGFAIQVMMRAHSRLTSAYHKCKLSVIVIPVQVVGRRNNDRLTLALKLPHGILGPACGDGTAIETTYTSVLDDSYLTSTELTLFLEDGSSDELTADDSSHLGTLTERLTLHLACPVRLSASEAAPVISVLPINTGSWPLLFDDSKTSTDLNALAATPSGVVGLTRPGKPYPPIVLFRAASTHATLRHGLCFWVNSIQVEFTPVEILMATKYPAGSCEYTVIREHEMLHYQDLQALFIRYQARVIAALHKAGLPTIERPVFVGSFMEGSTRTKARLQSTVQPIYALMDKELRADADARDAPEQRLLRWSQCPNWYAQLTRVQSRASFLLDLDREILYFGSGKSPRRFRMRATSEQP